MTGAAPILTAIVTTHSEGRLLRPTLRSVERAFRKLHERDGLEYELLIVADNADDATAAEARLWSDREFDGLTVRVVETNHGESGEARNSGVSAAAGEFVALIDGDDLVSENYFTAAMDLLRQATTPTIAHPQFVVSFGERSLLWETDSAARGGYDFRDLLRHNLWPSSSVGRRSLYLEYPFQSLPPEEGYGPEDWIWNIETTAAGVAHEPVPGTLFFYRLRETGGVNNRHRYSLLPPFDLDALMERLPIPQALAAGPARRTPKQLARGVARRLYRLVRPVVRKATARLDPETRRDIYYSARRELGSLMNRGSESAPVAPSEDMLRALREASELDPSISWTAKSFEKLPVWHPRDDGFADVIADAYRQLKGYRALVTVPWVGVGGADLVSLNYAKALQASERYEDKVAFLGTYLPQRTHHEIIPGSIRYAHLQERWLRFTPELRARLVGQLLTLLKPELIVSVNSFHVTDSLKHYHRPVLHDTSLTATMFAFDRIGYGFPVNPITDDNQRQYLDQIDGIITDNTTTAGLISDILALEPPHVKVHRQPVTEVTPELQTATRAYNNEFFSDPNPFRLIWPHRLDEEKRPDAVASIARELRRRGVPAVIDVWGQQVLSEGGDAIMRDLADAGVQYKGPYSGGLFALPTYDYHALLLTSKSEGLPLVLVQALFSGLPVVASNVGGVGDIIIDERTGLLTDGPDDIAGYVDAIERLIASRDLRRSLIEGGYAFAAEQHSWESFLETVETLFP